jgi:hypothetical protein
MVVGFDVSGQTRREVERWMAETSSFIMSIGALEEAKESV